MNKDRLRQFIEEATAIGMSPMEIDSIIQTNQDKLGVGSTQTKKQNNKILSQSGPITQYVGNYNPNLYRGINRSLRNTGLDIGVPQGTQVSLPPGTWQILQALGPGYNQGYGQSILAKNQETNERLRFSHLSQLMAQAGLTLPGGSSLGLTGATGNVTGPHLDLEYYNPSGRLGDVLNSPYAPYLGF